MFCPNCGNDMRDGAKFCDKCGQIFPDLANQTPSHSQLAFEPSNQMVDNQKSQFISTMQVSQSKKQSRKPLVILSIIAVVLVIVSLAIIIVGSILDKSPIIGVWSCEQDGVTTTIEFTKDGKMTFTNSYSDDILLKYQLPKEHWDEHRKTVIEYSYTFEENTYNTEATSKNDNVSGIVSFSDSLYTYNAPVYIKDDVMVIVFVDTFTLTKQ